MCCRKQQSQHSSKVTDLEREIARLKTQTSSLQNTQSTQIKQIETRATSRIGELEREIKKLRSEATAQDAEVTLVQQAKKAIEIEGERVQRRTQAEAADQRATISRLEVDLMKVS